MDITDLMSILDTAKKKNDNAEQKAKGKTKSETESETKSKSETNSEEKGTGVKPSKNDKSKPVIVEAMTHTFKPSRGAKIGLNDKWAEFEEKMKQQKRDEMKKKAEEIKRRLEEEERREKEEKERLKQERREAMIKEKKKIWEEQFGKKPSQESKPKHKVHSDYGDSKSSKSVSDDRKRTHSISDDDEDIVSVKVTPDPEKPKKPKIKKFNRPMPPPVNFADILKMAEQKQHEPVHVKKKPLQPKKMEGRPLSQYEKDRLKRTQSKEYKKWAKHGVGKPPDIKNYSSDNDTSSESDNENSKKNNVSATSSRSAFSSVREHSPAVSKVEHKPVIHKKEPSSLVSQKRPLLENDRLSGQSKPSEKSHNSEQSRSAYKVPKISDSSTQIKGSHSASSSKLNTNSESVSKHRLSSGLNPSKPSLKPKMSSVSDSKMTKHSGHSKSDDSVHKSSSNHRLSNGKNVSVKVSSSKLSSNSNHVKSSSGHHKVDNKSSSIQGNSGSHHTKSSSNHAQSSSNHAQSSSGHAKSLSDHGHSSHAKSLSSHEKSSSSHEKSSSSHEKSSSHGHSASSHAKSSSSHGNSSHAKSLSNHSHESKTIPAKHCTNVDSRHRKRTHSISDAEDGDQVPSFKSDKGYDASNSAKLSSNSVSHNILNKFSNSRHSVSSDKKLSRPSSSSGQLHSESKMSSMSSSGSNHKLSNNKVLSKPSVRDNYPHNNHGKSLIKTSQKPHSIKYADNKLVSKDKHSHTSKTVKISEKEVNRLKVTSQGDKSRSAHHENNRKDVHKEKSQVKQMHKHSFSDRRSDSERSKSKGDSNHRNNYDSVHEAVLICGPTSSEEDLPKKNPSLKYPVSKNPPTKKPAPPASNPWDRIYGEIKKKTPKPAMKKKNVIASDSEDDMDGFIDDDDDCEDPADLDYSKYIKQIFGYDRNRYRDDDGDVDNMESSYSALMKEEARSARIGLLEDLEDMKREEDEFKQKMMQKKIRRI